MKRAALFVVVMMLTVSVSAFAQTAARGASQQPVRTAVGPAFVDANGDGNCDNVAARGARQGRGMGRGMGAGVGRGMRGGFGAGLAFGRNGLASPVPVNAESRPST